MEPNPYQAPHFRQEPIPLQPPLEIDPTRPICVEFNLTLDDYVSFNIAHNRRGSLIKWMRLVLVGIAWIAVPIAVGVYLYRNSAGHLAEELPREEVLGLIGYAVFHTVLFPLLIWLCWSWITRDVKWNPTRPLVALVIKRMLSGDTSSMFGRLRLTCSAERIHQQGAKSEGSHDISAVQKLVLTPEYLFIYVSPMQAYIIPFRAFAHPDDFERFVLTLEEWTKQKRVK
jgi:hypothetical protein